MPNARRQGVAAETVVTVADEAVAERPAAPMDKPKRLSVRSAVGVRILAGGERANNGGEADEARLAAAATGAVDAADGVIG